MPAKAGIQWFFLNCKLWIPAFAGMTVPGSLFIYIANRAFLFALMRNCIIVLDKIGKLYNYVITVCDEASGEKCPLFPAITKRLHWEFDDPSTFEGSQDQKLEKTRVVRDRIKLKIEQFLQEIEKLEKEPLYKTN